jgi:hypothetical protein
VVYSEKLWEGATGRGTINGIACFVGLGGNPNLTAHELGHSLGFPHSSSFEGPFTSRKYVPYGDVWDIMGAAGRSTQIPGIELHLNAWKKAQVGWIAKENVQAPAPLPLQLFVVYPTEDALVSTPGFLAALRFRLSAHKDLVIYNRDQQLLIGEFAFSENEVTLDPTAARALPPVPSYLYDMTPFSKPSVMEDMTDAGLPFGETFGTSDFTVRNIGRSGRGIHVEVKFQPNATPHWDDRAPDFVLDNPHPLQMFVNGKVTYTSREILAFGSNPMQSFQFKLFDVSDPLSGWIRGLEPEPPSLRQSPVFGPSSTYAWTVDYSGLPSGIYFVVGIGQNRHVSLRWLPQLVDNE